MVCSQLLAALQVWRGPVDILADTWHHVLSSFTAGPLYSGEDAPAPTWSPRPGCQCPVQGEAEVLGVVSSSQM